MKKQQALLNEARRLEEKISLINIMLSFPEKQNIDDKVEKK